MGFNFPFYIAFLTGVFCAWATHSPSSPVMRLPWGALCVCALLALWSKIGPSDDIAVAVIYCVPLMLAAHSGVARLILESQFLVRLGGFSYSLYLLHFPIIMLTLHYIMPHLHPPPYLVLPALIFTAVPASFCIAWIFSLVFERPFQSAPRRHALVPAT